MRTYINAYILTYLRTYIHTYINTSFLCSGVDWCWRRMHWNHCRTVRTLNAVVVCSWLCQLNNHMLSKVYCLSHSHTLILSYSHSHSLTLSLSHSLTLILSLSHSLTLSLSHTVILSLSHTLILSFSHTLILSLILSLSYSYNLILSLSYSVYGIPEFTTVVLPTWPDLSAYPPGYIFTKVSTVHRYIKEVIKILACPPEQHYMFSNEPGGFCRREMRDERE